MNLSEWLKTQRTSKKKGTLDYENEKRLKDLGVVWSVFENQWEEMFALLVQFKQREGNCNVARRYKEDEKNLGKWLSRQRTLKKKGTLSKKKGTLDYENEKRLE